MSVITLTNETLVLVMKGFLLLVTNGFKCITNCEKWEATVHTNDTLTKDHMNDTE